MQLVRMLPNLLRSSFYTPVSILRAFQHCVIGEAMLLAEHGVYSIEVFHMINLHGSLSYLNYNEDRSNTSHADI